ncbi:hypothetical protein GCM10027452_26570 [Micromonospora halotolerans]
MKLLVVGASYRTAPVATLEQLAVPPADLTRTLDRLVAQPYVAEAVLVSTCNRVEVYAAVTGFHGGLGDICAVLAEQAGAPPAALAAHLYVHYDAAAVDHVFRVASGLDSMVVGEAQILGQLRDAYHSATGADSAGRLLHELMQQALRVGKRAHAETNIDRAGLSVVTAALETGADLRAYAVWNAIPGATAGPQDIDFATDAIWLRGTALGVRAGDGVLVVGAERRRYGRTPAHSRAAGDRRRDDERWDFRVVTAVEEGPPGLAGWTRLVLAERIGWRRSTPLTAEEGVEVYAFATRTNLFGWNAPMAGLLAGNDPPPPGISDDGEWIDIDNPFPPGGPADVVEVDGDHPRMVPGSWLLLERPDYRELYAVEAADPAGGSRFAVSGRSTRLRVDITENLDIFGRRGGAGSRW